MKNAHFPTLEVEMDYDTAAKLVVQKAKERKRGLGDSGKGDKHGEDKIC